MPQFEAEVIETVEQMKLYVVEADDIKEAQNKLEIGDTVIEVHLKDGGVVNRVIHSEIECVESVHLQEKLANEDRI